jgi:hypothetical protein
MTTKPTTKPTNRTAEPLPFTRTVRGTRQLWTTPPAPSRLAAETAGRAWAAEYVQAVADGRWLPGSLASIVGQMDHQDRGDAAGFRIGFLAGLEALAVLAARGVDPAAHARQASAHAADIEAARTASGGH